MKKTTLLFVIFILFAALTTFLFNVNNKTTVAPMASVVPNKTVNFIVFGDSGTGSRKQKELAQRMLDYPFDLILHTGDIAYNRGTQKELEENFFEVYKEHLAKAIFFSSPGNHDYLTDNLAPYLKAFELPVGILDDTESERYYSLDYSNIHFVSLDTNTPFNRASDRVTNDMLDWLEKDLKDKDTDEKKTWTIVFFHHPPYSSGKKHGSDLRVRQKLVPILEKYNVDLVFSGHEHNFERTCKIRNDECSENGVEHVVTGGGGGPVYQFGDEAYFTASRSANYHFVLVNVDSCKLDAEAIGIRGQVLDKFGLNKCEGD